MINSIVIDWTGFKAYIDANLVPFKYISSSVNYQLYLSDGALIASCLILKDGGSDQTDFEANYLSRGNNGPAYYSTYFNIRQTAGTAANSTVFSMRNNASSTRIVLIEKMSLVMGFDTGTPIVRSLQRYYLSGFSAATPTGGTQISAAALETANPATQVTDIRYLDTGLTTSGVSFGNPVANLGCPAVDGSVSSLIVQGIPIKLMAGEGMCVRLASAAVAGQSLTGFIMWSER